MIEAAGFKITGKRYIGYLAYPLIGFPDIMNLRLPIGIGKLLIKFDNLISKTPLKKLAWSLMVTAKKEGVPSVQ